LLALPDIKKTKGYAIPTLLAIKKMVVWFFGAFILRIRSSSPTAMTVFGE